MSQPGFTPIQADAYKLLHDGVLTFSRAEQAGMRIDVEYCERKKRHLTRKEQRLERLLESTSLARQWRHVYKNKTNFNSDYQLSNILYKKRGIEPPKLTASGQGSTDEETLKEVAQHDLPELQRILDLRKVRKTRDTYLDAFLREQVKGYIHPFLNLHTVRTYRGSVDSPNLQNIPKRDPWQMGVCRRAIFPRPGHQFLEVDFGALEVAISACYNHDPNLIEYQRTDPGAMHSDLCYQIFVLGVYDEQIKQAGALKKIPELKTLRDATKNGFTFPQFYGDYHARNAVDIASKWCGLSKEGKWKKGQGLPMPDGGTVASHFIRNGIKSLEDFTEHMRKIEEDFWGRRFKVYADWKDQWIEKYRKQGYIDMHTGFRCSGVMSRNDAINYPIQGSAFHCLLWSFIKVDQIAYEEGWNSRLVNQIHDSMILDVHPDELEHVARTIRRVTCVELPKAWPWIVVPLDVEMDCTKIDCSWNMKEGYEPPEI